jgi:hypothetical protein
LRFEEIISTENLTLAWQRISTGSNHQYKRIFRDLYAAYGVAADDNLRSLRSRLKGTWQPAAPDRIYLPKPSGLQRPLSLLRIEDQIVQQALANIYASRLRSRRKAVELSQVFSNVLAGPPDSIFFLRRWQETYQRFQKQCRKHFHSGHRWIASFDLAAFYDTISHDLLVRVAAPRSIHGTGAAKAREWLECWSQGPGLFPYRHGIAQGPIASDFLAEAFLLPLDEALRSDGIKYVRYVDDIRLFAKSRTEAQRAAIRLEVLCRQQGLIPQGKKFFIIEAKTLDEVFGQLPSIPPDDEDDSEPRPSMTADEGERIIREAITGRPRRVSDKAKLRFALFRAPRSRRLLGIALHLLDRYPEHIDAILTYLALHRPSKSIDKAVRAALSSVANEYARGELWRFAARSGTASLIPILLPEARKDLSQRDKPFWQRLGALTFILRAESLGLAQVSGRVRFEGPLAQALVVRSFSDAQFSQKGAISRLLRHRSFEPSLALTDQLAARGESHRTYGVKVGEIAAVTQNVLRQLGIIVRRRNPHSDDVGLLLAQRFSAPVADWKRILGPEYSHALRLLILADSQFDSSRSLWLQHLNSFNDILVRRVISLLANNALPGGARTVASNGKLVKMGTLVQAGAPFDTAHPTAASAFRATNDRRNKLPSAHPFDEKTGQRNRHLLKREQGRLRAALSAGYTALQPVLTTIP